MRLASARSVVLVPALAVVLLSSASHVVAQSSSDMDWQKEYSLSGNAALTIETSDSRNWIFIRAESARRFGSM